MQTAIKLAAAGFFVFPLGIGEKTPAIDEWQIVATRNPAQIEHMWRCPVMGCAHGFNIGIRCGKFGDGRHLTVIDVDNKNGKCGDDTLAMLATSSHRGALSRQERMWCPHDATGDPTFDDSGWRHHRHNH